MRPIAVIKIGTTSTVLLVASSLKDPLVREQTVVDLMAADRVKMLTEVLERFDRLLRPWGNLKVLVAGGEALRIFPHLQNAVAHRPWPLWRLTAVEEGRLTYAAVKAADPHAEVVVDLGGGSLELITATKTYSFPWGAARPGPDPGTKWPPLPLGRAVLVGGTAVLASRLLGRQEVTAEDLKGLILSPPGPQALGDPVRARIFPQGLNILNTLVSHYRWPCLTVTSVGLTEGLWLAASLGRGAGYRE